MTSPEMTSPEILYTGILMNFNNVSKIGTIIVDASCDPNEPNITILGKDLPDGFVFTDNKYKSHIVPKTLKDGKVINIEVFDKDENGKLIYLTTKVSFIFNSVTKKALNITIIS